MAEISKIKTLLGFAQKSGKLVSGDFAVKKAFADNKIKFLFVARDAAPKSRDELCFLAKNSGIEIDESLTAQELGMAIGKDFRVCAGLLDMGFLKMLG